MDASEPSTKDKRRFAFLSVAVDFVIAAMAAPLSALMVEQFQSNSAASGLWPAFAFIGFSWCLAIIPRLSHDVGSQPVFDGHGGKPTARTQWVFLSIMLGASIFLFAVPWVMGSALEPIRDWYLESAGAKVLAIPASLVLLAVFFVPFYLFLQPSRRPLKATRVVPLELALLVVGDLVALVGVALWEWAAKSGGGFQGEPSLAFYPGMLIVVPVFLFVFGGPRIVMLNRRFSWGAALSLFLSTAWYLTHDFLT